MRKALLILFLPLLLVPSVSKASPLTTNQVNSIILLLEAFGVDPATINSVKLALAPHDQPQSTSLPQSTPAPANQPSASTQQNSTTSQPTIFTAPALAFSSAPAWEVWGNGGSIRLVWSTNKEATSEIYLCEDNATTDTQLSGRCGPTGNPTDVWGNTADWVYARSHGTLFWALKVQSGSEQIIKHGQVPYL